MKTNIEQKSKNVLIITHEDVGSGFEKFYMISSDRHHDSTHCDRKLELLQLENAKRIGAGILDFGDVFDAMQGRNDPRSSYENLRPEYVGVGKEGYFNVIVKDASKFYKPFPFILMGKGNHESSVEKKNGIELISNLVYSMNEGKKEDFCYTGGYGGWVKFAFKITGKQYKAYSLKYMHGWGGGGPVTRGVIDTNRQAVYEPDADIVVNGHVHEAPYVPIARERLSQSGDITTDLVHFIRTPGYKDSFGDGSGGWDVETGKPPKPRGCYWLRFYQEGRTVKMQVLPDIQ